MPPRQPQSPLPPAAVPAAARALHSLRCTGQCSRWQLTLQYETFCGQADAGEQKEVWLCLQALQLTPLCPMVAEQAHLLLILAACGQIQPTLHAEHCFRCAVALHAAQP